MLAEPNPDRLSMTSRVKGAATDLRYALKVIGSLGLLKQLLSLFGAIATSKRQRARQNSYRGQAFHVLARKLKTSFFHELLSKLPVGSLVGGSIPAIEARVFELSRVVVCQAGADEVAVCDL